jgi:hypothetical protein
MKMHDSASINELPRDTEKGDDAFVEYSNMCDPAAQPNMTVKEYLISRVPTLKPPGVVPTNPFKLLGLLSRKNWMFFSVRTVLRLCLRINRR